MRGLASGNGATNTCSATTEANLKALTEKKIELGQACSSFVSIGETKIDDNIPDTEPEIKKCVSKILYCNKLNEDVAAYEAQNEEEGDTDRIIDDYLPQIQSALGFEIPSLKKASELSEEEKNYLRDCPRYSSKEHAEQKKILEEKEEKLEELISKNKKEIEEVNKKAIEENADAQKKAAEIGEKIRDEEAKTSERLADHYKDTQAAMKDLAVQSAELREQERTKRAEHMRASYKFKEANKGLSLQAVARLKQRCQVEYKQALIDSKQSRYLQGQSAALNQRSMKLSLVSECVRKEVARLQIERDQAEAEMKDAASDIQSMSSARTQLTVRQREFQEASRQQEQAIRQNKDIAVTAHQELMMKQSQDLQRMLQARQQEIMRINADLGKLNEQKDNVTKKVAKLGKATKGEKTIEDAKSALAALATHVKALESAKATESNSCKTQLKHVLSKHAVFGDIDPEGNKFTARSRTPATPTRAAAGRR